MHVIIYFKCLPQICTKMNYLKFDFPKYFLGGAQRAPIPKSLNPVFSRAYPSVLVSPLILRRFAPSTRALTSILGRSRSLRTLASSLSLNFRLGSPPNKLFNPPLAQRLPLQNSFLRLSAPLRTRTHGPLITLRNFIGSIILSRSIPPISYPLSPFN